MGQGWYYDFMNPNSALKKALHDNGLLFGLHYVKDICSVQVSKFKYKNIERIPELTSEILETAIMFNFNLCFYNHAPSGGWVLCRYVYSSTYSRYLRPITVTLELLNGQVLATDVPYQDIILVRDNAMDIAPFLTLVEYIQKIEKVDTAVFKALNVATLPLVLAGNRKNAKQLDVTAKKLGCDDAFIVGDDTILDSIKAFDIDVKINPKDIYELKSKYKNECLSSMGIYSVEQKQERKIVSEVASQNDYTDHIYADEKTQRLSFIDELNKRDPNLELELEETYWVNVKDSAKETELMAEAQQGGDKDDTKNRTDKVD